MQLNNLNMLVLGHNGMLGKMVVRYFAPKVNRIITLDKRFNIQDVKGFFNEFPDNIDVIINAIGKIPQKSVDPNDLFVANALLPLALNEFLNENILLFHPSTDCVFSGEKGDFYSKNDKPDAKDAYGISKRLGENALKNRKNTFILRVSIIGTDNKQGLLGWFLSNKPGTKLKGYANHFWNGITTLEWCKQTEKLIADYEKEQDCKLLQLGTKESYSKYQMLLLFQKVFKTDYIIKPFDTENPVDKRLVPDIISVNLETQLYELLNFVTE